MLLAAIVLVAGGLGVIAVWPSAGNPAGTGRGGATSALGSGSGGSGGGLVPVVSGVATLPDPLQDPAVAAVGSTVYAFGGLDPTGASSTDITAISGSQARRAGTLPTAVHDAAAAAVGGRLLVLGGGQTASFSGIATYTPGTRAVQLIGQLPTPLSDLVTAVTGGHLYVVGGYTGAVFSNRILEVTGSTAHTVATLPTGLRYATVAVVGGKLLIAGGRTTAGASRAIYRFDPATRSVRRIGSLPYPLMHASGGAIGGTMYVVGGITAAGVPSRWVLQIDPQTVHTRRALALPLGLSDAGVAQVPGGLMIVGGAGLAGPVSSVYLLHLVRAGSGAASAAPPTAAAGGLFTGALPGDLMIADRGNNRILIVNPAGRILWQFPKQGSTTPLYFDDDTFFADGGRTIISNEEDHQDIVQIAFPSGKVVWRFGHPGQTGSAFGYLNWPDDAYKLPNGMVTVADAYNCRVLEIVGQKVVRSIGRAGHCVHDPPRYLGAVNGDTPIPGGKLLVSEINGSYIDEFTLSGKLVRVYKAPVVYPSDPQLTRNGNILLADYTSPGGIVILDRRTGRLLWQYRVASGPGRLDHPSLAAMLPNGDIVVNDDYNDRVVIIDPHTNKVVWQYGHTGVPGTAPGFLNTPDGMDFIPVTASGAMNPAAIHHP